ncbi:MAG: hypothetical protein GY906_11475 [bacterium]|nr:hypothetical protein [bacterium]
MAEAFRLAGEVMLAIVVVVAWFKVRCRVFDAIEQRLVRKPRYGLPPSNLAADGIVSPSAAPFSRGSE